MQDAQTVAESGDETLFFVLHHFGDEALALRLTRVGAGHEVENETGGLEQYRVFKAEHLGVSHRPAHDPAQDVTTPFI